MKKICSIISFLSVFLLVQQVLLAQQEAVVSGEKTIEKMNRSGLQTSTRMEERFVTEVWENYLRKQGRVSSARRVYTVENAKIPAISDKPVRIISTVEENKGTVTVFCAFDLGNAYVTRGSPQYVAAEYFMKQFVGQLYEEERNERLKGAEKALADATRQQEKRLSEGEGLTRAQTRNRDEKANLEKKLEENRQEAARLIQEVETNKRDQQTAAQEVEKKRRAVEEVKARYAFLGKI
jgi:hypothetical protein